MLQQMQQMKATGELDLRRAAPPAAREAPIVLTREMVQRMALENQSITRANFKLITRGFGRIGAPTMSIEDALSQFLCQVSGFVDGFLYECGEVQRRAHAAVSGNACCSLKHCMKKEPHKHTVERESGCT
jgi:hypothetical protein